MVEQRGHSRCSNPRIERLSPFSPAPTSLADKPACNLFRIVRPAVQIAFVPLQKVGIADRMKIQIADALYRLQ